MASPDRCPPAPEADVKGKTEKPCKPGDKKGAKEKGGFVPFKKKGK